MTVFTPEDLNISRFNVEETDKWVIVVEYDGTPYEAFQDVPFLTNSQSGDLSEYGALLLIFDDEESATDAFSKIRGKNMKYLELDSECKAQAILIHNGIIIADTEYN
jgi:hypothetical protein